ncbi:SIS domain-containing protein [Pseudomonas sp. MWU12-2345]|uniref:KpsF/GutQ family sugar-phosphate isomerase n=1 Tax=Pseudomonas sp. MWU12-2345 TaxID=2928689 RepID=UPI00201089F2|nr:SIS domain-containing protein [Pseudomonas sp. MWU12-2345]
MERKQIIASGRNILTLEAEALFETSLKLDSSGFAEAIELIYKCTGHVILLGVGKSGHIGNKIAATLSSTGTPSFFMHPVEARHGDMGAITQNDVVLLISYSGETEELISLIPCLKNRDVKTISITGNPGSSLAEKTNVHIALSVRREACPHNLAPTASSNATLALGDALAIVVMQMRGFTQSDFLRNHPAGALGRTLIATDPGNTITPTPPIPRT